MNIFISKYWYLFYNKRTPLHISCYQGCLDVIKYLLTLNGIDINPKDKIFLIYLKKFI